MRAASAAVLTLLLLPFAVGDFWAYQLGLLYLYAIAALGIGLCWGRTGFLPLGQGTFFGLAAYLSGLALIELDGSVWLIVLLPLAACASGLLAFLIGVLVFRRRGESGPYFSMITLALSLLAYQVANNWESVTGGFNGLKGIPGLPGLDSYTAAYEVAAVALAASAFGVAWLYRAPLGVLWAALAHNERRVVLFGFDGNRLKAVAFGVSGLLAGIGGALYAPQQGLVTPQLCGFGLSADLVIWAAVGGRFRLLGPVLGAVLIGVLTSGLRDRFQFWEIGIAIVFIAVVLLFPQGLIGIFAPLERRFGRRPAPAPGIAAPTRTDPGGAAQLVVEGVHVRVGEVTILDGLVVRARAARHLLRDRPERGRQDLDLQHAERRAAGAGGSGELRRPAADAPVDAPDRPPRHRPQVPDSLGLSGAVDRRQRRHRAVERARDAARSAAAAPAPLEQPGARGAPRALSVPRRCRTHALPSSRTASGRSSSWRWRCSASRACCSSTSPAPGFRRRRRRRSST